MSIDKHCRHRGSDAGDAPLLLELEGAAGDGDVVIGGKESKQAEDQAANGLRETEAVETGPKVESLRKVWRKRRLNAAAG